MAQAPADERERGYPPEELLCWSERQQRVLELLVRRRSNAEIAEDLGLSLEGAKYHIREIMSKLDVDTREDAAEYWRWRQGLPRRLGRAWGRMAGALPFGWSPGGVATIAVAGVIAIGGLTAAGLTVATLNAGAGEAADEAGDVDDTHPLETISAEQFGITGLRAEAWAGSTDGFLSAEEIHEYALDWGDDVVEMMLVQLSQEPDTEYGRTNFDHPMFEEARTGPVWAVVFGDRPPFPEADARPEWDQHINVQFFSPRTGDMLPGGTAAIFEDSNTE